MYNIYFVNSYNERRIIGSAEDKKGISTVIQKFLDDHNFKSYYQRMWNEPDGDTIVDVGSHTEFFLIKADNTKL